MVELNRLGRYGNGTSHIDVATTFAISVGSAYNFTKRVVEVLYSPKDQYTAQPNIDERDQKLRRSCELEGTEGLTGIPYGCEVDFSEKPGESLYLVYILPAFVDDNPR